MKILVALPKVYLIVISYTLLSLKRISARNIAFHKTSFTLCFIKHVIIYASRLVSIAYVYLYHLLIKI